MTESGSDSQVEYAFCPMPKERIGLQSDAIIVRRFLGDMSLMKIVFSLSVLLLVYISLRQYFTNEYVVAINSVNVYSKPYPDTARRIGDKSGSKILLVLKPGEKLRVKSEETKSYRVFTVDMGEGPDGYVIYRFRDMVRK